MTITDRQARELKDTIERGTIADAVKLLKEIAPEAFKPALVPHYWHEVHGNAWAGTKKEHGSLLLSTRGDGRFTGQFFLSSYADWAIEKDEFGVTCLVAREKEK